MLQLNTLMKAKITYISNNCRKSSSCLLTCNCLCFADLLTSPRIARTGPICIRTCCLGEYISNKH